MRLGFAVLFTAGTVLACGGERDEADAGFIYRDAGTNVVPDAGSMPVTRILVDRVYDGDTVHLRASSSLTAPDGQPMNDQHVRLLGVDAPEIAHPEANPPTGAQCWGPEAAAAAQALLVGEVVTLEYDEGSDLRDRFGRLLAYVKLGDGRVANEVLIRDGHAESFRSFPHKNLSRYNGLEEEARDAQRGLWGPCR
ncbi:thermonuclease family protein [Myxococcota bacterium]|nr:thermonuclease family protein [Myxococcota bacterium]